MDNLKQWIQVTAVFADTLTEYLFLTELLKVNFPGIFLDGDVYLRRKDFTKVYLQAKKTSSRILSQLLNNKEPSRYKELLNTAKRLTKMNFSAFVDRELTNKFNLYLKSFKRVSAVIGQPFYLEYAVSKLLKENIKGIKEEELAIFFYPLKKSEAGKEKIEILNLALEISKNKKSKQLFLKSRIEEILKNTFLYKRIENLKNKYSFLGMRFFSGKPHKVEYYIQQIKDNLQKRKIEETLALLGQKEEKNKGKIKQIVEKYNIKNKKVLGLIKFAREVSFYRNWRIETLNKANYFVLPLLKEIAKRLRLNYEDLIQLTDREIFSGLKTSRVDKSAIKDRKKGFAMIITKDKKIKILTGRDLEKMKNEFRVLYKKPESIKGIVACQGKVTGRCVIIAKPKDFGKVKRGNIIVTKMTTPDFVSILGKSKALITDIGGLTCHAAIVSRELGIPCIIGTKIATKVLKDGDLVEVDANKGKVKILN